MGVNFSEFFIHCIGATPSGGASRYWLCHTKFPFKAFFFQWSSWQRWFGSDEVYFNAKLFEKIC